MSDPWPGQNINSLVRYVRVFITRPCLIAIASFLPFHSYHISCSLLKVLGFWVFCLFVYAFMTTTISVWSVPPLLSFPSMVLMTKYPHLLRLDSKTLLLWGLSWLYPSPTDHVYLASSTSRITYIKSSITNLSQMYPLTSFSVKSTSSCQVDKNNQYPEVGVMTLDLPTGTKAQKKQ